MSKKPKKYELVLSIFKPNEDGISEWKTREELDTTLLKLGNNGNTRHGVVFGVSKFLWEIKRQRFIAINGMKNIHKLNFLI